MQAILNYFSLKLKNITLPLTQDLVFQFFVNYHNNNVVSKLPNVVKLDVKNGNVVLTWFKVVHIKHRNRQR